MGAESSEQQKHFWNQRAHDYDATAWPAETSEEAHDVAELIRTLASLPLARTLDLACGTGFLTQHLRGDLTLVDASDHMLAIAATRLPAATLVCADALPIPATDSSFDRVFSSQFYHHLQPEDRRFFLTEARRVAPEIVLVERAHGRAHRHGSAAAVTHEGTTHEPYTASFSPTSLLTELGGGELLYDGPSVFVTRTRWDDVAV